jgi:hypothetical protein
MAKPTGNPNGRPRATVKDPKLIDKIADCFLVAFTDEQTAAYCGICTRTIERLRAGKLGGFSRAVKIAELQRELKYRKKIWDARGFWQGAAWFLERKYPGQFSKPEVQLQLNQTLNSGPNNLIILGPERAKVLATRQEEIRKNTLQLLDQRNGPKSDDELEK